MTNQNRTKVSMVIPCYNKAPYIDEMLQSVYGQKHGNIELILVNDGSADGTREKISEWLPRFEKRGFDATVIDQENKGLGAAIRVGLERVAGDYVCMPDCDDLLHPEYVSRMARELDGDDGLTQVWWDTNPVLMKTEINKENLLLLLLLHHRCAYSVWRKMIRASAIKTCGLLENYIDSRIAQEPQINIPLCLHGSGLRLLADKLYIYRKVENSMRESVAHDAVKAIEHWTGYQRLVFDVLDKFDSLNETTKFVAETATVMNIYTDTGSGKYKRKLEEMLMSKLARQLNGASKEFAKYRALKGTGRGGPDFLLTLYSETFARTHDNFYDNVKDYIKGKRIVLCAANSRFAQSALPLMLELGIAPHALWDEQADGIRAVCGLRVTKPDYASLKKDDVLIIMAEREDVVFEIRAKNPGCAVFDSDECEAIIYAELFNRLCR
jgi:glycosyltransferase involved in cell wall biosynthesis